jgi:hypothetical protein
LLLVAFDAVFKTGLVYENNTSPFVPFLGFRIGFAESITQNSVCQETNAAACGLMAV